MMLGSSERAAVHQHVAALSTFLDLGRPTTIRDKVLSNDQALGVMIAALLMRKGTKLDAAVSEVLTDDYLDALEDVPAWSVREALRKWNRGESQPLDKKPHDFNWRPEPAALRRLAWIELARVRLRIEHLQALLSAEERIEYSDEHRRTMLERLRTVIKWPMLEEQPAAQAAE